MLYFLIPVYNEALNIPELSINLRSVLPNLDKHFIFVNDCSTDNTNELIHEHFKADRFTVLTNLKNSGPGFSFNSGLEHILTISSSDEDCIVTLEGDNTSDLSILPVMYDLCSEWQFDLVLSSVYAQGGGFSQTSLFRKLISLVANQILRVFFDIKVLTLSSFYRVYKIGLINKVKSKHNTIITESGFICALELLIKSIRVEARIIEVPMILKSDKRRGKSKMKILKTSLEYLNFFRKQL